MKKLSNEQRQRVLEALQQTIFDVRGEDIGLLQAEQLLQCFEEAAAPLYYNRGVEDAGRMVLERMEGLDEDIASLKQSGRGRR
ncbi:DUF2164 family protein [Alkalicoccus urumqiensis]|uniref:DUF2164 family protein n=1 Tax=Alkalicoccus urumqiensis TaxID=1548213 RepID=UPI0015E61031|nr:DUF2164 family protein [Alkalicoccus urumqiensis]